VIEIVHVDRGAEPARSRSIRFVDVRSRKTSMTRRRGHREGAEALEDEEVELLEGIAAERAEMIPSRTSPTSKDVGQTAVEQRQVSIARPPCSSGWPYRAAKSSPLHCFGSIGEMPPASPKGSLPLRVRRCGRWRSRRRYVLQDGCADMNSVFMMRWACSISGRERPAPDDVSQPCEP